MKLLINIIEEKNYINNNKHLFKELDSNLIFKYFPKKYNNYKSKARFKKNNIYILFLNNN